MKLKIDLNNIDLNAIDNALNETEHKTNNYFEKVKSNPAKSFGKISLKQINVKDCNNSVLYNV